MSETYGAVPYPSTYLCRECQGVGMMLSESWISWHDDHGDPNTEPAKYLTCVYCDGKGTEPSPQREQR